MVHFLHQCQQAADFTVWETFAGEPVQVVAGQVGQQATFVFAKGHLQQNQFFQIFSLHGVGRSTAFAFNGWCVQPPTRFTW